MPDGLLLMLASVITSLGWAADWGKDNSMHGLTQYYLKQVLSLDTKTLGIEVQSEHAFIRHFGAKVSTSEIAGSAALADHLQTYVEAIQALQDSSRQDQHADIQDIAVTAARAIAEALCVEGRDRSAALFVQWEDCKAKCRAQRDKQASAVSAVGMLESQRLSAHQRMGEARLALANYQPAPDMYASREELENQCTHRGKLESEIVAATEAARRLEGEITQMQGWVHFEAARMAELAQEEEQLRIQLELAADPSAQQFNVFGLATTLRTRVEIGGGLGLMIPTPGFIGS
jgi:hypothetical protein